ncbi:MAG: thioredoxin family protein [Sphingopyxis sp.]|uniref:protein-disulfide reductase DsbD family protein n=1 Tax=Sphingopyxis sp. TaxID=1908224 RepID=UPI002AB992D4|nr:thioredoxin family protein [Sphingopyxis sp.]MDZ3830185.1 thioredoxin family protein [Sphingopyxis sp.]
MNFGRQDSAIRGWRAAIALMILALFAVAPARAQMPNITAQLVAETQTPAPGSTTSIALTMDPAKGWHGYWVNGGDAGFGLSVEWNAPEGVHIAPFQYPVPEPLILFGMMNHVYEHPYALLADVRVDKSVAPGTDLTVSGIANWLACTDKVCVPEKAVISVKLVAGNGAIAAAERERFDAWRARLPQPLGQPGRWERRGDMLRFAVPLPKSMSLTTPHLFAETQNLVDYAAPQSFSRNGDDIIIETKAKGEAAGMVAALLKLDAARGLSVRFEPGAVPAPGERIATGTASGASAFDMALFWTALGGAIVGGLILNLMPCVFPILSLKALSLARSGGEPRAAKVEGLAYTAGAVITALLLGGLLLGLRAAGEQVGWAFQLQHPLSVLILLLLAVAITLNLAGTYELPSFGGGAKLSEKGGATGGFWTGALAAFVATPCSGPLLGAALGATLVLPAWAALPIFGGLGLGLALPFLAIAFLPALRNRLPKPGPWMAKFRRWMAVPMALTALALGWLLWRQLGGAAMLAYPAIATIMAALFLWHYGAIQRGDRRHWVLGAAGLLFVGSFAGAAAESLTFERQASLWGSTFSPEALAKAQTTGQPVFVYFTADWCLSCKANEAGAINREAVQKAFDKAGVVTLVGDWTNGDPVITRTLAEHGRNSVPLYLWYAPGAAKPEILPQILTPGMLVEKAKER